MVVRNNDGLRRILRIQSKIETAFCRFLKIIQAAGNFTAIWLLFGMYRPGRGSAATLRWLKEVQIWDKIDYLLRKYRKKSEWSPM